METATHHSTALAHLWPFWHQIGWRIADNQICTKKSLVINKRLFTSSTKSYGQVNKWGGYAMDLIHIFIYRRVSSDLHKKNMKLTSQNLSQTSPTIFYCSTNTTLFLNILSQEHYLKIPKYCLRKEREPKISRLLLQTLQSKTIMEGTNEAAQSNTSSPDITNWSIMKTESCPVHSLDGW